MVRLSRVHTWEEHLKLVHILVVGLVTCYYIAVFLSFYLWCGCILRMSLFLHRNTHITLHLQFHRCIIGLSVEQWCIAVLLAVEVVFQREHIVGRVLIHRRVRIGANHYRRIARIANHHHSHHHRYRIQPTRRDNIFLHKEHYQHRRYQHNAYHSTLLNEWHTCQRHRQHEGDNRASIDSCILFDDGIGFPYCPYQCTCHQHEIDCQTCIEWTAQHIGKQQLKPSCYRWHAWNDAVQYHCQYGHRYAKRSAYAFP